MISTGYSILRFRSRSIILAVIFSLTAWSIPSHGPVQATDQNPAASYGTGLFVNTFSDDPNATDCRGAVATNNCSLRGAITIANKTSGVVVIYLQAGTYSLFGEDNDDKNKGGDLDIDKNGGSITIRSENQAFTVIDGRSQDRIFDVHDSSYPTHLILKNITLENGDSSAFSDGGSIRTFGSLDLDLVEIQNSFGRNGGAIYIRSSYYQIFTMTRSTISYATASLDGGAIYATSDVTAITNSTFDHNNATGIMGSYFNNENAGRGGAIYNNSHLSVTSSTFANNSARKYGGGIFNYAFMGEKVSALINSSTFLSNSSTVLNQAKALGNPQTSAVMSISNSILASTTENCTNKSEPKGYALLINKGNNLDTGFSCGFGTINNSHSGVNPRLGELANFGGPTETIELLPDSPAMDNGNPYTCAMRDQRGLFAEVICDIGAFEANATPWLVPSVSGTKTEQRLQVTVQNQVGNPLVGWNVDYDLPDAVSIPFSSYSAQTDGYGSASVTADPTSLSGVFVRIAARSGGSAVWFQGNASGFFPDYQNGLPNTGFAPGIRTLNPSSHNIHKIFHSQDDVILDIPELNISLPVVGIPKDGDGWDVTWLSNQAGYLEGTAFPSYNGNSVLTAHVTLADGNPGPFSHLSTLRWGDIIQLHAFGITYTYEVRNVDSFDPNDKTPLTHKDRPWITLLTCQDYDPNSNTYLKRLAVSAVLISQE